MSEGRSSKVRHQTIIELLSTQGQVYVQDLAKQFDVAQETIRRDLSKLESQKLLKKVHGGAVNIQSKFERNFSERAQAAVDEKKAIAVKAASLIKPGDTLFIDFGTTTFEFSQRVKLIDNITVITNSPLLANTLQENPTIETILIGGQFNAALNACLGGIALKNITEFFADYAVIGAGAIHHLHGVMDQHVDEAAIAQKMMENSDKLMVLADSTKTNKHAINVVTGWGNIDYLITTCKEFKLTDNKKRSKTKIIVAELT